MLLCAVEECMITCESWYYDVLYIGVEECMITSESCCY